MKRFASFKKMRSLAGVDDDDALSMVDDPSICGQPLDPASIGEDGEPSCQSVPVPLDLCAFYPHEAGLDGVHLHGKSIFSCG